MPDQTKQERIEQLEAALASAEGVNDALEAECETHMREVTRLGDSLARQAREISEGRLKREALQNQLTEAQDEVERLSGELDGQSVIYPAYEKAIVACRKLNRELDRMRGRLADRESRVTYLEEWSARRVPADWHGLMQILDQHYPESTWPTGEDDPERDPGHRIVSLIRLLDREKLRADSFRDITRGVTAMLSADLKRLVEEHLGQPQRLRQVSTVEELDALKPLSIIRRNGVPYVKAVVHNPDWLSDGSLWLPLHIVGAHPVNGEWLVGERFAIEVLHEAA